VIGIPVSRPERSRSYSLLSGYVEGVCRAGAVPLLLPAGAGPGACASVIDLLDGVLLAGGRDVNPERYGRRVDPGAGVRPDDERDAFEIALLEGALERGIPVLGICRGAQVINVAAGGTLHQDLGHLAGVHRRRDRRHETVHAVRVSGGSLLAKVLGWTYGRVNSLHHQAIERIGAGLEAVAWSDDDEVVEGLEAKGRGFVLGVQWHPEELLGREPAALRLFEALVDEALRRRPGEAASGGR